MNLYFSILGKLVFDFSVIREICVYFRVIIKATSFAGIIFHILGILASLKLVNYTKLDAKPTHSMSDICREEAKYF